MLPGGPRGWKLIGVTSWKGGAVQEYPVCTRGSLGPHSGNGSPSTPSADRRGLCGGLDWLRVETRRTPHVELSEIRLAYQRIDEDLERVEGEVVEPKTTAGEPRSQGDFDADAITGLLNSVLADLDQFWARMLADQLTPAPAVIDVWLDLRETRDTACGLSEDVRWEADDDERATARQTTRSTWPSGTRRRSRAGSGITGCRKAAGYGRARGDFGVAYVLAHEVRPTTSSGSSGSGRPPARLRPRGASNSTPTASPGSGPAASIETAA